MRLLGISLRFKLTLWFLVIFAVLHIVLSFIPWLARTRDEGAHRDEHLLIWSRAIVQRIARSSAGGWTAEDLETALPVLAEFIFVAVTDDEGDILLSTGHMPAHHLLPRAAMREGEVAPRTLQTIKVPVVDDTTRSTAVRLSIVPFRDAAGEAHYLYAGADDTLLNNLPLSGAESMLISLPIGLIAAGIAGWLLAGRAVAPMQRVSEAASTVDPSHLDARIKLESTEEEVQRLETELNHALERIEKGYREQSRFITHVAHELKTPISVILAEAHVAVRASNPDQMREFISSVEQEIRALGRLIDSFLLLARNDQGGLQTRHELVPLNDVLTESVQRCESEADGRGVRLLTTIHPPDNCDTDFETWGDPELLAIMFNNLIRHAIQSSPGGAAVEINSQCTDNLVTVSIRDHGDGIPDEERSGIFDVYRANSRSDGTSGGGLGLPIAQSIAVRHKAAITLDNADDGGTCFKVEIPLGREDPRY